MGWLVCSLPRRLAAAGAAVLLAAVAAGTVRTLQPAHSRPAYRKAAAFINARAQPGDAVLFPDLEARGFFLSGSSRAYLKPGLRPFKPPLRPWPPKPPPPSGARMFLEVQIARPAFAPADPLPPYLGDDPRCARARAGAPPPPEAGCLRLAARASYDGILPMLVGEYVPSRAGSTQ